jgi:hypothetical protein
MGRTHLVDVATNCSIAEHVELLLCLAHEHVDTGFHIGRLIVYVIYKYLNKTEKHCSSRRQTEGWESFRCE